MKLLIYQLHKIIYIYYSILNNVLIWRKKKDDDATVKNK